MNSSTVNVTNRAFTLTTAGLTVQLTVFSITFILGIVGNNLLVATVCKRPALHRVTYYLISALAIEDLLTLITYGVFIPQALVLGDWFLGDFACLVNSFLTVLCGYCELYLLAVISLDRYIACCRPLRYSDAVTPRRCAVAIALCWIFALALTSFLIIECKFYGGICIYISLGFYVFMISAV
ncbi:5-hydroxytryptamine receptor 4-like [Liolophura sinensis]|uniref:5-hydroxytryptamine receptor 4-like n=1 Tax=Liolophura sinensis TaxID=3198878 RepID=UPI0031597887